MLVLGENWEENTTSANWIHREWFIKILISGATTLYFCFERQFYLVKSKQTNWATMVNCCSINWGDNMFLISSWKMYFLWAMIGQNSYPFVLLGLLLPSVPTFEACFLIVCFCGRRIKIKIYSLAILRSHCLLYGTVPILANNLL